MISVLVVDDHSFVRQQVMRVLDRADGIEVVGECADGSEVVAMADRVRPDVVLMDVRMPQTSGTRATRELLATRPGSRVVMLTGSATGRVVEESERAGAVGFLLKGDGADQLIDAVRTVAAGGTVWPPDHPTAPVR